MQIRLHDRSGTAGRSKGLSCDGDGLWLGGDHALIEATEGLFGRVFRRRTIEQINHLLSAGYGAPVDLSAREPLLDRIADCLIKGDVAHAQLLALQLRLPDLPDEAAADRLAKAESLLRFNPNHDALGRFASAPDDGASTRAQPPDADIRRAAASALDAEGHSPIQGEFTDPYLNALNDLANGKPLPTGQPTPNLDRYLNPTTALQPARPDELFGPVTLNASDLELAKRLNEYLAGQKSKLGGYGDRIVYWGKTVDIDPRLLVALAGAETGFGAHINKGANNYWNWLWAKPTSHSSFPTVDRGIQSVARGLDRNFDLSSLRFYDGQARAQPEAKNHYCTSGCTGTAMLYSVFKKLGGDPDQLSFDENYRPHKPKGNWP